MNLKSCRSVITVILVLALVVVSLAGCSSKPAAAPEPKKTWPEKEIHLVWHSRAGSGGDILLRHMSKYLEGPLGKPVIVENREGANGATAWNYVKNAAPDGYTLLGISSTFVTASLVNKMGITVDDFEPIALMYLDPMVIYCRPGTWKNFGDFMDYVKKNPGKVKIAGGTPGNINFTFFRLMKEKMGLDIKEVPFEGGGEATVAVAGGHLDIGLGEYGVVLPMIESKQLEVLVSFNKMEGVNVETLADYGIDVKAEKFRGMLAPKGTPKEIIDKIYKAIESSYNDPEIKKYAETSKLVPYLKGPEETRKAIQAQFDMVKAEL